MKAHYTAFGGKLVIEVEGATIKDLFRDIGTFAEVLDGDQKCGACGADTIFPREREASGFRFYELCCSTCTARLSFGQHKEGESLFAKRRDKDGKDLPNRGWEKYIPHDQSDRPRSQSGNAGYSDPPELQAYLKRVRFKEQEQDVFVELGDRIAQVIGDAAADLFWKECVQDKPTNADLVRRMYNKIEALAKRTR